VVLQRWRETRVVKYILKDNILLQGGPRSSTSMVSTILPSFLNGLVGRAHSVSLRQAAHDGVDKAGQNITANLSSRGGFHQLMHANSGAVGQRHNLSFSVKGSLDREAMRAHMGEGAEAGR